MSYPYSNKALSGSIIDNIVILVGDNGWTSTSWS